MRASCLGLTTATRVLCHSNNTQSLHFVHRDTAVFHHQLNLLIIFLHYFQPLGTGCHQITYPSLPAILITRPHKNLH